MTDIVLNKETLIANIRQQIINSYRLKYQRTLLEFENLDGSFLGDNVFETTFLLRDDQAPLIYEVSGPYDVISNEYATIGRIYESGQCVFECDIKAQIQQRTAAMVCLFFESLKHEPKKPLIIGAGKLAIEIIRYLNHVFPAIDSIDYHARNQRTDTFEASCNDLGVATNFQDIMNLEGYDTIIMVTNTSECLINTININSVKNGAVIASLCTTSQTGEITGEVYGRQDVNVLFDYDLTRTFTPDMRAADKVGYLQKVILLNDILNGEIPSNMVEKKNILRITGTPMQNIAVLDMMRAI
tara:strand:+ start:25 stop:921 length:897 start_codon:yes stop_codon:yes gene_type:complete